MQSARSRILFVLIAITTLIGSGQSAQAVTRYVSTTGGNVWPYTSWANAATTIQPALTACQPGDTVIVADGTYGVGGLALRVTNNITLRSANGKAACIIDGNNVSTCVEVKDTSVVDGFTIQRGVSGGNGGGVRLTASAVLRNSTVTRCSATANWGGGVYCFMGGTVENCEITYNGAREAGGGVAIYQGGVVRYSTIGYSQSKRGGGLYIDGWGGAANCTIEANLSSNYGGGVYFQNGGSVEKSKVWFNDSLGDGGGVYCSWNGMVLNSTVANNNGYTNGGGIFFSRGGYASECRIADNQAFRMGGGMYCTNGGWAERCVIDNNRCNWNAAGAYLGRDSGVRNCVITRNTTTNGNGGGISTTDGGHISYCTIVSNTAIFGGGVHGLGPAATARYSIVYFNKGTGLFSNYNNAVFFLSCTLPLASGQNIGNDPKFVNKNALDLRLTKGSPCIDTVNSGLWIDLLGVSRPLDGNNNGVASEDMGAYEYVHARADTDQDGYRDRFEVGRHSNPTLGSDMPYAFDDFNSDRITDLAVYQTGVGNWFIRSLGPGAPITFGQNWGGAGLGPVPGDYNGDKRFDLAVFDPSTGTWFIRRLGPGPAIIFGDSWGFAGCKAVPGDYDGDKKFDMAVYDTATGNWYIRKVAAGDPPIAFGQNWGGAGMTPVPGDYNGDGQWDLAVYNLGTGDWYIRSLGAGAPITFGQNWGGPGLIPVAGDFNADGMWDLAAYQSATGNWFIRSLGPLGGGNPPICFGQNWGGAGLVPVIGDYSQNGFHDLATYQTATGNWFIRGLGPGAPLTFGQNWGNAALEAVGTP